MANILITGGSGFIGRELTAYLKKMGHKVAWFSRSTYITERVFQWDPANKTLDIAALKWADYIIHLAGENIAAKRWRKKRKEVLLASRVDGLNLIKQNLLEHNIPIQGLISASGINYYFTSSSSKPHSEHDKAGNSFLATLCQEWEMAAKSFEPICRVVYVRTPLVLASKSGALPKMMLPAKLGFGVSLGNGKQIVPWIHYSDLLALYTFCIENAEVSGAVNAVAPSNPNMDKFQKVLCKALKKPFWLPRAPSSIVRLIMGEMADIVLHGESCSNRFTKEEFRFRFSLLRKAFDDLV